MKPGIGYYSIIFLAIFLIAYGLAGLGVPLGALVPILALVDGTLILLAK